MKENRALFRQRSVDRSRIRGSFQGIDPGIRVRPVGTILDLSIPTVRFHLKKAGDKLGGNGRLRIVHHAAALGFVSLRL